MGRIKIYRYAGKPFLTRGDLGVNVEGAHTRLDDPGGLYVTDPDWGDVLVCRVEQAEEMGFLLVGEEEAEEDPVCF